MKIKSNYFIACLFFGLLALAGCKEDEAEIGEPFSKVVGLTATDWILTEVYLVDEGNPAKPERNLSEIVISGNDPLELSFQKDSTFTASGENSFFPSNGTWTFDYARAPTEIILVAPDGTTTVAPLGGPTRISDAQLKINFVKQFCNVDGESKAALGYRLVFNRKQ